MADNTLCAHIEHIHELIRKAEQDFGRAPGEVWLVAASKIQPVECIRQAQACGLYRFGESYWQEAKDKIKALNTLSVGDAIEWHFIGPIQSNKTHGIANAFTWVHSLDREKIARRLSVQRDPGLPTLQVCIQVNVSAEPTKAGVMLAALPMLAEAVAQLPNLKLRGLMVLPAPSRDEGLQRRQFAAMRQALEDLNRRGHMLDTLSMGTSQDLRAAIAEGATLVRIGTALFGPRPGPKSFFRI